MRNFFYDLGICILACVWLPKVLLGWLSGKYKKSLKQRLGIGLPQLPSREKRVWIHAVSMGETKAAAALATELKKRYPSLSLVISSTTETGQEEAKRSIPYADAYFFLPLDFTFIMRRLIQKINPSLLILVEGEFWWNLIREAKKADVKVALVNGKISERSFTRFEKLRFFSEPLFASLDCCCVQTPCFKESFIHLGVDQEKIIITGNLKFDFAIRSLSSEEILIWRKELGLDTEDIVIVLASTHENEEELVLDALQPLLQTSSHLKILVVPRHPSRFEEVAKLIQMRGVEWLLYSERAKKGGNPRILLIDTMGQLMSCFQLASLAIVAGSFVPGIGGHNLFEPASVSLPVIFGPYVEGQSAYAEALLQAKGGVSAPVKELSQVISNLIFDIEECCAMGQRALEVVNQSRGAVSRTVDTIEKISPFL